MNIVVLCGGLSNERDVSISSGTCVARALSARGHRVALLDLYLGYDAPFGDPLEVFGREAPAPDSAAVGKTFPELSEIRALRPDDASRVGPNVLELCRAADIVFLALHGEEGENGKVQALFDLYGVRYTGCGYLGSALAMHKGLSKTLFRERNIPTPEFLLLRRGGTPYRDIGFPCVVKPCSGGSSVGISIVRDAEDFLRALETAFRYDGQVMIERYIKGRELTVGVLGGEALPVIEIIPKSGFYDYRNKYQAGATEELCPAPIGDEATVRAQRLAKSVGEALMLDAYYRIDVLWDTEADVMYCIEANTLPGMTPTSLIPRMGEAAGIGFGRVCEMIIEESLNKNP